MLRDGFGLNVEHHEVDTVFAAFDVDHSRRININEIQQDPIMRAAAVAEARQAQEQRQIEARRVVRDESGKVRASFCTQSPPFPLLFLTFFLLFLLLHFFRSKVGVRSDA
jgi:hypothetical protein